MPLPTPTECNGHAPPHTETTIRPAVRRRFWKSPAWTLAALGNVGARSLIHLVNVLAWLFVIGMVGWSLSHSAIRRSSRHTE